jgi:signal recognition particle receptor subunit beta
VSSINFHTKEISVKIVYYGPGLCGKTTSLQTIYGSLPQDKRPQLVSLATEVDRTIFFDFLPVTAYKIRDFKVRLQLYTVPGQVFYNATRKLVLNGVDGIVFVADSQRPMKESNLESLHNLQENLVELGLEITRMPLVLQYNKRDLVDIFPIEEMEQVYNLGRWRAFPTIAVKGEGLYDALKAVSQMVVDDLLKKGLGRQLMQPAAPPAPPASVVANVHQAAAKGPTPLAQPAVFGTVEEAMSRAVGANQPSASLGLWPAGEATRHGERIEMAMRTARWNDVLESVEQLVQLQARRWASSEGQMSTDDPVTAFLLLRGVSPSRFRALREAGKALRAGHAIGRSEAMSALVLALEVLW